MVKIGYISACDVMTLSLNVPRVFMTIAMTDIRLWNKLSEHIRSIAEADTSVLNLRHVKLYGKIERYKNHTLWDMQWDTYILQDL